MKIFIVNGKGGCVDCNTEFFNGFKWKKICDYDINDKILQYNADGTAELVIPEKFIVNKCENLNLYQNTYLDFCVSDDHECYYITSKNNLYHKPFYKIKENFNKNENGFFGKFITAFNYKGGKGLSLTNEEIELMLAIIADGHIVNKNTGRTIINLKKDRKKNQLRNILIRGNFKYREYENENISGYTRFTVWAPRIEKIFSKDWYSCTKEQLELIGKNVLFWDGNCKNQFYTTSKENADFIQFVFSAIGKRASIIVNNREDKKNIEYTVCVSDKILHLMNKDKRNSINYPIQNYKTTDGKEYCFTVDSGMWIMRRNNKISITGNCGKTSFEKMVVEIAAAHNQKIAVLSTIDYVKDVAKNIGWDGTKTFKNRRMLSDLKDLLTRWNDSPHQSVCNKINNIDDVAAIFIDSREPEDIQRFIEEYQVMTVLVQRGKEAITYGNHADDCVDDFDYDICVDNSRGLNELFSEAQIFYECFIRGED